MKRLPRLLDLYCGAGGAGMGYHQAGFEVIGVDIEPQPNYPFKLIQADVIGLTPEQIVGRFDVIHASPPCLAHSNISKVSLNDHQDLIPETRELLEAAGLPYVIENVVGAPLIDPTMLCGSSFGLRLQRHRLFESSVPLPELSCEHAWQERHRPYLRYTSKSRGGQPTPTGVVSIYGGQQMAIKDPKLAACVAMGIDWMTQVELRDAIPPAYTRYIGRFMQAALPR